MLNLNKTYTVKSNANRDIRKAIERGECAYSEYEVLPVDGGFQITALSVAKAVDDITPEAAADAGNTTTMSEQDAAMDAPTEFREPEVAEPVPPVSTKSDGIPDVQIALLTALLNSKVFDGKPIEERINMWVPFTAVHDSEKPHNLPKPSMAGIAGGLARRGLIQTAWGDEHIGKHVPVVRITTAGIEALNV